MNVTHLVTDLQVILAVTERAPLSILNGMPPDCRHRPGQLANQDREFSVVNFQSWYVEQNEKASGRRPFSKARDVFYPVGPSNTLRGQSLAPPNWNGQAGMLPGSLFDWNHHDREPFQNRKSVRFDAPLSGAKTVWR